MTEPVDNAPDVVDPAKANIFELNARLKEIEDIFDEEIASGRDVIVCRQVALQAAIEQIIAFLLMSGGSTFAMNIILAEIANVLAGGSPSQLFRPRMRSKKGRRPGHVLKDLFRGYLAAFMDYKRTTVKTDTAASKFIKDHVKINVRKLLGAKAKTIIEWRDEFGASQAAWSVGRLGYVTYRQRLATDTPNDQGLIKLLEGLDEGIRRTGVFWERPVFPRKKDEHEVPVNTGSTP